VRQGRWPLDFYQAIDQHGQVIDVLVCERRDAAAARAFFARAVTRGASLAEVTTDRAPVYPRVLDELVPAARHVLEQYANNIVEADHGRLKARLRPMRGMKTIRSLRTIAAGHAFVQNVRRGYYEITTDVDVLDRVRVLFDDLAHCPCMRFRRSCILRACLTPSTVRTIGLNHLPTTPDMTSKMTSIRHRPTPATLTRTARPSATPTMSPLARFGRTTLART
jgi:IS6 family transposase